MSDNATGPGPFFTGSDSEYNPNQGWENTEVWEGTEAECRFKQSVLIAAGANRIRLAPKGNGAWTVRCTFPYNAGGAGNYVDTLELEVNAALRSIYLSPLYRLRFSDYSAPTRYSAKANATLGPVEDCAKKYLSGRPVLEANDKYKYLTTEYATRELAIEAELTARLLPAKLLYTLSAAERTSAFQLFWNRAYRGVTGFIEYGQVFRRTVTAGNPQAISANQVGAGMIWTSAEVINWEGIPNNGWFTLPSNSQWHKDKPRVLSAYGQKTQITYSYTEIVTASALLYQAYGNAALIDT